MRTLSWHVFCSGSLSWCCNMQTWYYSGITWGLRHVKSPATQQFVQKFVQIIAKITLKFCIADPLQRESTSDRFPSQRASFAKSYSMSIICVCHTVCSVNDNCNISISTLWVATLQEIFLSLSAHVFNIWNEHLWSHKKMFQMAFLDGGPQNLT